MRDAPGHRQVARYEPDLPGHGPPGADPLDTRQALVRGHELQVSSLWQYGLWSFQTGDFWLRLNIKNIEFRVLD